MKGLGSWCFSSGTDSSRVVPTTGDKRRVFPSPCLPVPSRAGCTPRAAVLGRDHRGGPDLVISVSNRQLMSS